MFSRELLRTAHDSNVKFVYDLTPNFFFPEESIL